MSSDHRDVYIIRGQDESDDEGWLAPEPADEVIIEEIVDASDLSREDVEPLDDHVAFEELHALLAGADDGPGEVTFTVDGWSVTVGADGSVAVTEAE